MDYESRCRNQSINESLGLSFHTWYPATALSAKMTLPKINPSSKLSHLALNLTAIGHVITDLSNLIFDRNLRQIMANWSNWLHQNIFNLLEIQYERSHKQEDRSTVISEAIIHNLCIRNSESFSLNLAKPLVNTNCCN